MAYYVCIHGHFYQPPRENPWLETIEIQDSSYPFHDWNERIASECYGPNAFARLISHEGKIIGIVNNYARISFNFGPTLLSWLSKQEPEIYAAILEADKKSLELNNGHGTAIAQAYNHMILPLANDRDRITQIKWGIADFEFRFKRAPEGMWLPECAVDNKTLESLVDEGIKFTILSPMQAFSIKPINDGNWTDVFRDHHIDSRRAYRCFLPSGRYIDIFFYDGNIAKDIAFRGLLHDGGRFAEHILAALDPQWTTPEILSIATDGESYGHHHRYGEMALAYAIHRLESSGQARICTYGYFLEISPPVFEVKISENSSWSCVHGVERWKSDCGCNSGRPGWHQRWRQPLRFALDALRDELGEFFEKMGQEYFNDPWEVRDNYIDVILNRTDATMEEFLNSNIIQKDSIKAKEHAMCLLEMQRHCMLMYTSCGWFFDEISGIETTQILQYAARAMQLAGDLGKITLEASFLAMLKHAESNIPENEDGADVFLKYAKPPMVSLEKAAYQVAALSLFEELKTESTTYCFRVLVENSYKYFAGKTKFNLATIRIRSQITLQEEYFTIAALYIDERNIHAFVGDPLLPDEFSILKTNMIPLFHCYDIPAILETLHRTFKKPSATLTALFRDKQVEVIKALQENFVKRVQSLNEIVYTDSYPLLKLFSEANFPPSSILASTAEAVLNFALEECFKSEPFNLPRYEGIFADVRTFKVKINRERLAHIGNKRIPLLLERFSKDFLDINLLREIGTLMEKYREVGVALNLWRSQNLIFHIGQTQFFIRNKLAEFGSIIAKEWITELKRVSNLFDVRFE